MDGGTGLQIPPTEPVKDMQEPEMILQRVLKKSSDRG